MTTLRYCYNVYYFHNHVYACQHFNNKNTSGVEGNDIYDERGRALICTDLDQSKDKEMAKVMKIYSH